MREQSQVMAKKNFYAVKEGRQCNVIVETWDECSELVTGHSGAKFQGFSYHFEAVEWLKETKVSRKTLKLSDVARKKPKPQHMVYGEMYPCVERRDIVVNGRVRKNACVKRRGPRITGEKYVPSDDDSIPWD